MLSREVVILCSVIFWWGERRVIFYLALSCVSKRRIENVLNLGVGAHFNHFLFEKGGLEENLINNRDNDVVSGTGHDN